MTAVTAQPANDNFASAITLLGDTGCVNGTTQDATGEVGETPGSHFPELTSVWYALAPNISGSIALELRPATFPTEFDALYYNGNSVASVSTLTLVDDRVSENVYFSRFEVNATALKTLYIRIGPYQSPGTYDNFTLCWIIRDGRHWRRVAVTVVGSGPSVAMAICDRRNGCATFRGHVRRHRLDRACGCMFDKTSAMLGVYRATVLYRPWRAVAIERRVSLTDRIELTN